MIRGAPACGESEVQGVNQLRLETSLKCRTEIVLASPCASIGSWFFFYTFYYIACTEIEASFRGKTLRASPTQCKGHRVEKHQIREERYSGRCVRERSLGRQSEVWKKKEKKDKNREEKGGKEKYEGSFGKKESGGQRMRGRCVERGVWEKSIRSLERLEETISPVWPPSPLGVSVRASKRACVFPGIFLFHGRPPVLVSNMLIHRFCVWADSRSADLEARGRGHTCVRTRPCLSPPAFAALSSNMFYWRVCWGQENDDARGANGIKVHYFPSINFMRGRIEQRLRAKLK